MNDIAVITSNKEELQELLTELNNKLKALGQNKNRLNGLENRHQPSE